MKNRRLWQRGGQYVCFSLCCECLRRHESCKHARSGATFSALSACSAPVPARPNSSAPADAGWQLALPAALHARHLGGSGWQSGELRWQKKLTLTLGQVPEGFVSRIQ